MIHHVKGLVKMKTLLQTNPTQFLILTEKHHLLSLQLHPPYLAAPKLPLKSQVPVMMCQRRQKRKKRHQEKWTQSRKTILQWRTVTVWQKNLQWTRNHVFHHQQHTRRRLGQTNPTAARSAERLMLAVVDSRYDLRMWSLF